MMATTNIRLVNHEGKPYLVQGVQSETAGPVLLIRQTIAPGQHLTPKTESERDELVAFLNTIDYTVASWVVSIDVPIGPDERLTVQASRRSTEAEIRAWAEAEGQRRARRHNIPFSRVVITLEKAE